MNMRWADMDETQRIVALRQLGRSHTFKEAEPLLGAAEHVLRDFAAEFEIAVLSERQRWEAELTPIGLMMGERFPHEQRLANWQRARDGAAERLAELKPLRRRRAR